MVSSGSPSSSATVLPFVPRQSSRKRADLRSGQVFDLSRFCAGFQDNWQAFLQRNFDGPVAVAAHFGVTERAAQKWWEGIGGPRGDKLALALVTVPGAGDDLLRAA